MSTFEHQGIGSQRAPLPRPHPERSLPNTEAACGDAVDGVFDISSGFDAVGHDTPVAVEHDGNANVGPNHWLSGQQNPGGSTIVDEANFNASPKQGSN